MRGFFSPVSLFLHLFSFSFLLISVNFCYFVFRLYNWSKCFLVFQYQIEYASTCDLFCFPKNFFFIEANLCIESMLICSVVHSFIHSFIYCYSQKLLCSRKQ